MYEGAGCVLEGDEGEGAAAHTLGRASVVLMDASSEARRGLTLTAGAAGKVAVMLFAGKKLNEPIAWHGPIVMNTQEQLRQTFAEMNAGTFPPTRAGWDYKRIATKPKPLES